MKPKVLTGVGLVSVAGMIGVALAVILGFEEADRSLLIASALCMFAAPVAVSLHFAFSKQLTPAQRRAWLRAFTGRHGLEAVSAYLAASSRRATQSADSR